MLTALPWLALLLGFFGNCGFWLFCFNRVNAFGYPRPVAKLAEKICIFLCFAIPGLIFWLEWPTFSQWLNSNDFWPPARAAVLQWWLGGSLVSMAVLGPLWLESRFWLIPPRNLLRVDSRLYKVHQEVDGGSAKDLPTRLWARLPLNEWAHLEVTQKLLLLHREVPKAEGLTIGHLSDLHFTGQYRSAHYQFVLDRLMEHRPELIILSGDIIDFQHCIPMIDSLLGRLSAPLGCFFVLGNHERRLKDPQTLVDRLTQLGWIDLGIADQLAQKDELRIFLSGNESPWFQRRQSHQTPLTAGQPEGTRRAVATADSSELRIGVAHSPDRIRWARRQKLDILLAGHTHGGQARIPGLGPIVAPSIYGSKFASGVFLLPPTLMHVSRGVAGTHTVRWRCPTEVSILTLTNSHPKQIDS